MMKIYVCDFCGNPFQRQECYVKGKRHLFCSRQCLADFSSKSKNPNGYANLKDYTNMAINFSNLAKRLNPTRMTPEIKAKIRKSHLGSGKGKTYTKYYGKHEHRIVAERILGRPLKSGEVVHHIDSDVKNNNPENLHVFASQKDHAAHHAFLDYVLEMKRGDAR